MTPYNCQSHSSYNKLLASNISNPVSATEEQELFNQYHSAKTAAARKAARDRIACANIRFVAKAVNEFQNKSVDMDDMFSEALAAMVAAIDTFDASRGNKFITHAIWAIRGAITAFLNQQESLVHIPANRILERRKVTRLLDSGKTVDAEAQKNARQAFVKTVSIDLPTSIKGESSREPLAASISDSSFSTEAYIDEIEQKKLCEELLSSLPQRESYLVKANCGFFGDVQNYRELESCMDISRERIRQIRNAAIEKLRQRAEAKKVDKHSFYLS